MITSVPATLITRSPTAASSTRGSDVTDEPTSALPTQPSPWVTPDVEGIDASGAEHVVG